MFCKIMERENLQKSLVQEISMNELWNYKATTKSENLSSEIPDWLSDEKQQNIMENKTGTRALHHI